MSLPVPFLRPLLNPITFIYLLFSTSKTLIAPPERFLKLSSCSKHRYSSNVAIIPSSILSSASRRSPTMSFLRMSSRLCFLGGAMVVFFAPDMHALLISLVRLITLMTLTFSTSKEFTKRPILACLVACLRSKTQGTSTGSEFSTGSKELQLASMWKQGADCIKR